MDLTWISVSLCSLLDHLALSILFDASRWRINDVMSDVNRISLIVEYMNRNYWTGLEMKEIVSPFAIAQSQSLTFDTGLLFADSNFVV